MTGDDNRAGADYDQPRVPTPLRERVDELFLAERGYEAASFQEALSVVVDLAEASTDADEADSSTAEATRSSDAGSASNDPSKATPPAEPVNSEETAVDEVTTDDEVTADETDLESPDSELSDPAVDPDEGGLVSFDEYVDGLEETRQDPSPAVESILDTEHADDAVRELAAEVLDEMTRDAFQELEHGVDEGLAGVTDGMGAARTAEGAGTAPSGSNGDGVPETLTADPESDCAICERSHPVSVLQTSVLDEDGSVELVCPSCAE